MCFYSFIFAVKMNKRFVGIFYDFKIDSFFKIYGFKLVGYVDSFDVNNVFLNI